jgi:hypothetical protein
MEHIANVVPLEHSMLDEATEVLMSAFQKRHLLQRCCWTCPKKGTGNRIQKLSN